jgi:prepilin-type processing-associated H-X9-DG protein
MTGRGGCVVLGLLGVVGFAMFVTWVAKARTGQERVYCANHLRMVGQFADAAVRTTDRAAPPSEVPPGTVVNPLLPPDRRLSWVVHLLPVLPGVQDTRSLHAAIDRSAAWDDAKHLGLSRAPIDVLRCPGKSPTVPFDSPAVTQFVGNGGVGPDAPSTPWPGPNQPHPTAGSFRYDAPTSFAAMTDGTSTSVLFAETDAELGPWLRGGPATVRTLTEGKTPVGPGGQFGGTHPGGANFAFADHSVRFTTDRTARSVLWATFTIAGGAADPVPGE